MIVSVTAETHSTSFGKVSVTAESLAASFDRVSVAAESVCRSFGGLKPLQSKSICGTLTMRSKVDLILSLFDLIAFSINGELRP